MTSEMTKYVEKMGPEYRIWDAMKYRTRHPERSARNACYAGVRVDPRWLERRTGFLNFLADVGRRPSPQHSIDRWPDQNGNYEPGNVRWATPEQQSNNRCSVRLLTYRGRRQSVARWGRELGIPARTITDRLDHGKSVAQALEKTS